MFRLIGFFTTHSRKKQDNNHKLAELKTYIDNGGKTLVNTNVKKQGNH